MSTCEAQIFFYPGGKHPTRGSEEAAGWDLYANLLTQSEKYGDVINTVTVKPGQRKLVPVGFALGLPPGWMAEIRPRSGFALKHGITITNSPGTVDSDYRDQVAVIIHNLGDMDFIIEHEDRIAQMVIQRVPEVTFEKVYSEYDLRPTARGMQGYGSSGKR